MTLRAAKIDTSKLEDKIFTGRNNIPNIMNTYFWNIGEDLKKQIPSNPNPIVNVICDVTKDSKEFLFSEISEEGIISFSPLRASKGSNPDSVPDFFIKIAVHIIVAFLFKSSLIQGVIPENWKHA